MIETSNDVVIVNEFIGNLGLMCYCSRRIMCALTPAASTPVLVLSYVIQTYLLGYIVVFGWCGLSTAYFIEINE